MPCTSRRELACLVAFLCALSIAPLSDVDYSDLLTFTEVTTSGVTQEPSPQSQAAPSVYTPTLDEAEGTPRGSMRATLKRLGLAAEAIADDEQSLREALLAALNAAKTSMLRGLLFERGSSCAGCVERSEYVRAVMASLSRPLVGRHALPLFVYDAPLFPHTTIGLRLFEPRYKLLCRKALKADRYPV
jgi:hypothetical protein